MNRTFLAFAVVASTMLGACSRSSNKPADSALNTDLSLAAQQRGFTPLDSISAAERADSVATARGARTAGGEVSRGTATRTASTTHHSSGVHRSGTSSGGSSGGVYAGSAPSREVTVKHTQRDAAIGAAAGAVLGATTSRNKVKGGIIGAAVGGILGGVIGNNVDKQKKPVP